MPDFVWPPGLKRTKQRDAIVNILENADMPLSAVEIYNRAESGGITVWLSTVYRTLDLLSEKGVVLKTAVLDSDMAYYELRRQGHRHYAVCVDCHKIVPMAGCPLGDYKPKVTDDFRVLGHRVEMYGYCKDCDKNKDI